MRVYGRQVNERLPLWQQELEVGTAEKFQLRQNQEIADESAVAFSSISNWLSQGRTIDQEIVDEAILPDVETERFLRFQFGFEDTALLPLASVKEVLQISAEEILPVPDMPNCVLGIYNCRGEMLWLVDLEIQIGLSSLARSPLGTQHLALRTSNILTAIAIQADDKSLAIVVPQVMDIEEHNPQALQIPSTGLFPSKLLPFIQRYLTDSSSPVLDTKALIQDSQLQMHHLN
ncbi:MAG TPA: chemotaxis protein [Cyanobacteria bacterium UBA11049]|nr:chemotaxis protein [Cyanobacteria bacterium UBA11049]